MGSIREEIEKGKTSLGIEFGSTRIKASLISSDCHTVAAGTYSWENSLENGIWTYSQKEILDGLKGCYADLKRDVKEKFGLTLKTIGSIGVSAMMHGYMPFDKDDNLLVPFRTWRNTRTRAASEKLTSLFCFNVPQRWSVAHLYQAMLDKEEHLSRLAHLTTLAVYAHYVLTGKRVAGIGEASGMFPVDTRTQSYDKHDLKLFDELSKDYPWRIEDLLPAIVGAGEEAGRLTKQGALLLDEEGDLRDGILFCPPEGDASTGMVATNSIRKKTGNVSAGTSIFGMVVLDKPLKTVHKEIDVVTTPVGDYVAMVHCNNCSGEINAWADLFGEVLQKANAQTDRNKLFDILFSSAQQGDDKCGDMLAFNFYSGEHILQLDEGKPLFLRTPTSKLTLSNFTKAQIFSALATLKIGMDILQNEEQADISEICAHGGFFKTTDAGQRFLAAALNARVSVYQTASEGGAWGMAVLAAYAQNKTMPLADFLDKIVFSSAEKRTLSPDKKDVLDFEKYLDRFKCGLAVEKAAVNSFEKKTDDLYALKKKVCDANKSLQTNGLVVLTWGNVSEIDREKGLAVIKPSGVSYEEMKPEDMVVVDLDGNVVDGKLKPSSDTATHLALYKAFPEMGGIVHTHSVYATAFAQAGKNISPFGTTHADYFFGDVVCTRSLTESEIAQNYEANTGKVIVETLAESDVGATPAILVKNHAPFVWGKDAFKAVENAVVLEKVAEMAYKTLTLNPKASRVDNFLLEKHYKRKHGKNAYYGQGEKK